MRPVWGRIDRVWSVFVDGRPYIWLDEIDGRFEFAVLYHQYHGLWYVADSFLLRDPSPWPAEVDPAYGVIERVGYPVNRTRDLLLIVEESELNRWWLLYLCVDDGWILAHEFLLQLAYSSDSSEGELSEESSIDSAEDQGSFPN